MMIFFNLSYGKATNWVFKLKNIFVVCGYFELTVRNSEKNWKINVVQHQN